ncbi:MAG: hypothetical protein RIA62_14305 [Cyclobacteriaceae bacterium]
MNPRTLRFLSLVGIFAVMILSGMYGYRTWIEGETRWYFVILSIGIAMLLIFNLMGGKKR